jgi:hypothetical protein
MIFINEQGVDTVTMHEARADVMTVSSTDWDRSAVSRAVYRNHCVKVQCKLIMSKPFCNFTPIRNTLTCELQRGMMQA